MQGKILDYNSEMKSGHLRDENEHRYPFFVGDCTNPEKLAMGASVVFEHDGEKATSMTVIEDSNSNISSDEERLFKRASAKKSKKFISIVLMVMLVLSVGGLIAILIMSEFRHQKFKEIEAQYESEIVNIKKYLDNNDCSDAMDEYHKAADTRSSLYQYGRYYSIETHAERADAIGIAECYATKNEFDTALKVLDIENTNNIDYLTRAANIYKKAGDEATAQRAKDKIHHIVP